MTVRLNQVFSRLVAVTTVLFTVVLASCSASAPASGHGPTPHPMASVPTPSLPVGGRLKGHAAVISGHIRTSHGEPVAGAGITFWMATQGKTRCPHCRAHAQVETGPDGSYSVTLQEGGYTAECDVVGPCGAEGTSGGGVALTVPPDDTLNFIVCDSYADMPRCLNP